MNANKIEEIQKEVQSLRTIVTDLQNQFSKTIRIAPIGICPKCFEHVEVNPVWEEDYSEDRLLIYQCENPHCILFHKKKIISHNYCVFVNLLQECLQ